MQFTEEKLMQSRVAPTTFADSLEYLPETTSAQNTEVAEDKASTGTAAHVYDYDEEVGATSYLQGKAAW